MFSSSSRNATWRNNISSLFNLEKMMVSVLQVRGLDRPVGREKRRVCSHPPPVLWSTIQLFILYVLFSQFRPRDVLQEFAFFLFVNYALHHRARGCTCIRRNLKKTVLWGTITWSEMGKQNIEAKNVFWKNCEELTSPGSRFPQNVFSLRERV